tara:strand:- start:418 stop:621 length:204 start_codon:yes stop_codon:yes gene_type:complete
MITKKLLFTGKKGSEHMELSSTPYYGEIELSLKNLEEDNTELIYLDISTAIALAKTLRTHINQIKNL